MQEPLPIPSTATRAPPPKRPRIADFVGAVWAACWLALTAGTIVWNYWRSRYLIHRWAADNAFTLVERRYRILFRGPFFRAPRAGHTVHAITIRDRHGVLHSGYVRCGGLWRALTRGAVEVRWDKNPAGATTPGGVASSPCADPSRG
jgi:hypothetical protein